MNYQSGTKYPYQSMLEKVGYFPSKVELIYPPGADLAEV
jgi:hypothetical protein